MAAAWCFFAAGVSRRAFASLPLAAQPILSLRSASAALPFQPAGLGERLARRDPALLTKPMFSSPPAQTRFPLWLEGTWDVAQTFDGFVFPSKRITRERIMREPTVPGLQKLSVLEIPDMGKSPCNFQARFERAAGDGFCTEAKAFNLASAVDRSLEARLVQRVEYAPRQNPNRASIIFYPGRTRNAERVELFYNAREHEALSDSAFVASEHVRQVTFSGSPNEGVVRQVSGSYGQYRTYRRGAAADAASPERVRLNVLTAAYLEPTEQEALYFEAVDQPVIIYSHEAVLTRAT